MDLFSIPHQLLYFGLLIISAYFFGKAFLRMGLGESTGQLLGGMLVSPYLFIQLGIVSFQYQKAFSSFQYLIFIFLGLVAFGIGEELHFERIKKVGYQCYIICFIQAIVTFILTSLAFLLFGFKPINAFIIGSIGVATAPAALFILMNKLVIEGDLRSKLANIVVFDDVLEIIIFSLFVQIALFMRRGSNIIWGKIAERMGSEVFFALFVGFIIFLCLKFLIKETTLKTDDSRDLERTGLGFLRFVFHETATPSVEIFIVLMGLIVIGSSVSWFFNLPFLMTITFAGFLVANFHSRRLFDSLFIANITPIINLIFFGLIGSSVNLGAFSYTTLKYVVVYIIMRSSGKILATWLACRVTRQDIKIVRTLPLLMLPQAGVSAVEVAFVALVLPQGKLILQIIVPSILFFEIFGILLSERTLEHWKSWVIGEADAMKKKVLPVERMLLFSFLKETNIKVPMVSISKKRAINELLDVLVEHGDVPERSKGVLFKEFMQRERIQSTGIGDNIAIPHVRSREVSKVVCAMGISPISGVDFDAIDGRPANIIFLFISPEEDTNSHLKILSEISFIFRNKEHRETLRSLASPKDIYNYLKQVSSDYSTE